MKKHKDKICKSSMLLLVESQTDIINSKLDDLINFKNILIQGISNFLLKPSDLHISLLISIFGFSKTFAEGPLFQTTSYKVNEFVRFYDPTKFEKPHTIEEDTMTEIRYIEKPMTFDQVSNRMKAMVLTNNPENAKFCHFINLDYFFHSEQIKNFNEFATQIFNEGYEVIIFDINEKYLLPGQNLYNYLEEFNKEILSTLKEETSYYFMFKPFGDKETLEKVINCHNNSINDKNPLKEKINMIIPKQTYEYLNGNSNQDFADHSKNEIFFSFLYELGGCRMDKITSFEMLRNEENFNSVGNKIINSHLFVRELTFRLGKLPKFGA